MCFSSDLLAVLSRVSWDFSPSVSSFDFCCVVIGLFELPLNCRTGGCRGQFLPLSAGAGLLIIVDFSVPRFMALPASPGVEILRFLLRVGFGVDVEGCLLRGLSFGGETDEVLR